MLAEMNDSLTVHDKAFVMCLVLDEADKFVGDPTSAHATTFHRMCGFDGYRQRNKPVMVIAVSATNCAPMYWFLRRQHMLNQGALAMKVVDIVSFKPPAANTYKSATQSVLDVGETMVPPTAATNYTTEQIVDQYANALMHPRALLLDTVKRQLSVPRIGDHVETVLEMLEERGNHHPFVVLYLHGGHTTHLGMMGLQFCQEQHLPQAEWMMQKLENAMTDATDEERQLAANLGAAGDVNGARAATMRADALDNAAQQLDENFNDQTECLEVHYLTPLAWHIKEKAKRLGHFTEQTMQGMLNDPPATYNVDDVPGRSPWSTKNVQLALFIVRKYIPDVPIVVVGGHMVRRSMSLVAVDYFRPKISVEHDGPAFAGSFTGQPWPLACVTHAIHSVGANAPDGRRPTAVTGQRLRPRHRQPDIAVVQELVIGDLSTASRAFTDFNAMPQLQRPLVERQRMLCDVFEATRTPMVPRTIHAFRVALATRTGGASVAHFDALVAKARRLGDLGDHHSDADDMLALGCALAGCLPLPVSTRQLLQRFKNPMSQARCGHPERDLGNIHANAVTIREQGEPLELAMPLCAPQPQPGRMSDASACCVLAARQRLRCRCRRQPANPPETWTIFMGLRQPHAHLVGTPAYTAFGLQTKAAMRSRLCRIPSARAGADRVQMWRSPPARPAMDGYPATSGAIRGVSFTG